LTCYFSAKCQIPKTTTPPPPPAIHSPPAVPTRGSGTKPPQRNSTPRARMVFARRGVGSEMAKCKALEMLAHARIAHVEAAIQALPTRRHTLNLDVEAHVLVAAGAPLDATATRAHQPSVLFSFPRPWVRRSCRELQLGFLFVGLHCRHLLQRQKALPRRCDQCTVNRGPAPNAAGTAAGERATVPGDPNCIDAVRIKSG
jgi:hypothetical protein